jgi:hypothetical protein
MYLSKLFKSHTKLSDNTHELVWRRNKHGASYTTKMGYLALIPISNDEKKGIGVVLCGSKHH